MWLMIGLGVFVVVIIACGVMEVGEWLEHWENLD
jgi:hypothetical protein